MPKHYAVRKDASGIVEPSAAVSHAKQASTPVDEPNVGRTYSAEVSSITELHYVDDDGTVTQITRNGTLLATAASTLTGANNASTATPGAALITGGFVFDPVVYGVAVVATFKAIVELSTADVAGSLEIRLYDMGPGTGAFTPVLRSSMSVLYANAGKVIILSQLLSIVASPGVDVDQLHNVVRAYELRAYLTASDEASARVVWAGLVIT